MRLALLLILTLGSCATTTTYRDQPPRHGWKAPVRMVIPGHPQRGAVEHI